jgi:FAD/FMN-containing dehydrogenase
VLTGGPEYEKAVTLFNAAVDIRPGIVVRCTTTADVQADVRAAREYGVPLSVRVGGHDFWGRSLRSGGLVIDLAGMREVRVDADRRVATVEGGALSSDVVGDAERVGLTAVTGTAGSVGMVGITLGGGYGPLTGRFGLAADNLLGAEVVLADGSLVDTDAEHEPDLFWALRGGGGNFGVVTSARIRLHPVPVVVAGTILLHQFHGAAARVPPESTAFGRREPHRMVEIISLWEERGAGDAVDSAWHLRWAEQLHAALEPFSLPGGYVNFLGPETPDQVTRSYGPNTRRLLAVKSDLDPESVFVGTPLPSDATGTVRS